MKVVALKDLNLGGTGIVAVTKKKGDIFELPDIQPVGGKVLFYNEFGTGKRLPLVLGTEINIVEENQVSAIDEESKRKQQGKYIFLAGGLLLTYLIYKIIKSK
jgi:hypothetical protein